VEEDSDVDAVKSTGMSAANTKTNLMPSGMPNVDANQMQ
jgi:hypothetical protein